MKIYILGISGTFMSGLALIATEAGHEVSGCDANCYPPVSDLLQAKQITWTEGYEPNPAFYDADLVIVGNAMRRGLPIVEKMLEIKKPYLSGPQWLFEQILIHRRVIAISGTHGKTTTTSMTAHILNEAGFNPGFLIGGVAPNFGTNARLGQGEWFVIEADEYDSAFFDKRPKFMHYHPEIAVLNNLEFDHADIYPNLAAIEQQFSYYLRTIPPQGRIILPREDQALRRVVEMGHYTPLEETAVEADAAWNAQLIRSNHPSQSLKHEIDFEIHHNGQPCATISWQVLGQFNVENALHAFVASQFAGVSPQHAVKGLETFQPVKRRLELRDTVNEIAVYDDFAHHPTAIQKTIEALRDSGRHQRILVALEFASYTMKTGVHQKTIADALSKADHVFLLESAHFDVTSVFPSGTDGVTLVSSTETLLGQLLQSAKTGDAILIMSNKGFENLHERLIDSLRS